MRKQLHVPVKNAQNLRWAWHGTTYAKTIGQNATSRRMFLCVYTFALNRTDLIKTCCGLSIVTIALGARTCEWASRHPCRAISLPHRTTSCCDQEMRLGRPRCLSCAADKLCSTDIRDRLCTVQRSRVVHNVNSTQARGCYSAFARLDSRLMRTSRSTGRIRGSR